MSATLDRSVILSQLLFGAVLIVVVLTLQFFSPDMAAQPLMLAAIAVVFVTTGITIVTPWRSMPRALVMVVPLIDILAIGLMRVSDPSSGVGLLWVFPTLWLASYFGLRGAVAAVALSSILIWISEFVAGQALTTASIPAVVMLPIALVFIATSAVLTSRRTAAQRVLLRTQAGQLERALRRTNRHEALLAEVLNTVDFGVVRLDRDGRGAVMNSAYARLYGIRIGNSEAARHGVAYGPDRVTLLTEEELPFNRAARGEEFDDVITWIPTGQRELAAVSVTARRLFDDDNEPDGSVLVARDVTAELRAVRARDDLVASVSHELRTPMTSVIGYIELSLDEPELPPAVRRNLEIMERNGERMLQLIASILQSARLAEAPPLLQFGRTDLGSIVRDAVEALRPRSDERDITVRVTSAEEVEIRADAFRIRQVVDNVLSNAVKYNREGGDVAIGVSVDGPSAWIVVRDTGIGISESELPKIFDRFFRSELVRQGSVHGSGLGLGIARDFVERHGGKFGINSEEGAGTTVIITLPVSGPEAK